MYDTKREYQTDEALLEAECDNMAVDKFAKAMKEKLALARAKVVAVGMIKKHVAMSI